MAMMRRMVSADAEAKEVGILKCRFNGVDAAAVHFGSQSGKLDCVFKQKRRKRDGTAIKALVEKYGIEVGIIGSRQLVWRVTTRDGRKLRREVRLPADIAASPPKPAWGPALQPTSLTGGPGRSYSFHPLAFEKVEGLNVAAGFLVLTLKRAR